MHMTGPPKIKQLNSWRLVEIGGRRTCDVLRDGLFASLTTKRAQQAIDSFFGKASLRRCGLAKPAASRAGATL